MDHIYHIYQFGYGLKEPKVVATLADDQAKATRFVERLNTGGSVRGVYYFAERHTVFADWETAGFVSGDEVCYLVIGEEDGWRSAKVTPIVRLDGSTRSWSRVAIAGPYMMSVVWATDELTAIHEAQRLAAQ